MLVEFERDLVESDLKLDKAIKLARLVETAIKEAKSMSGESRVVQRSTVSLTGNRNPNTVGNIRDIRNSDNNRNPVIMVTRKLVQVSRKNATAVGRNNSWRTFQTVRQEVRLVEAAGKRPLRRCL